MFSKSIPSILCAWGNIDVFSGLLKSQSRLESNVIHKLLNFTMEEKVLKLVSGVKHAAIVTEDYDTKTQSITFFGLNTSGQLGKKFNSENTSTIHKVTFQCGAEVLDVALGRQHSLVLLQETPTDRSIWGGGSNHYGQLLTPNLGHTFLPFKRIIHSTDVNKIVAGMDHSVFLHGNSVVSTAGWSADGQSGDGQPRSVNGSTKLKSPWGYTPIVDMVAGADHTLVLTAAGDLYAWGNSEYGQCCNGEKVPHINIPKLVAHEAGYVEKMWTSASSTLLRNKDHEWWYYGIESAKGKKILTDELRTLSDKGILSTLNHNFFFLESGSLFKGKSKFVLDKKLRSDPLFVASGVDFTLGLFPSF